MKHLALTILMTTIFVLSTSSLAFAQDGIPDNCETALTPDQQAIFPRFENGGSRLTLVDWRSGATVNVLAEGIQGYATRGWSRDCRYLAVAEGATNEVLNTVVYDTVTTMRMGSVDDAHLQAHHITWGPDDYLIVETRNGAILWHVPSRTQTTLTQSFNPSTVRNFSQIAWNPNTHQIITDLAMGGREAYDLTSGQTITMVEQTNGALPEGFVVYEEPAIDLPDSSIDRTQSSSSIPDSSPQNSSIYAFPTPRPVSPRTVSAIEPAYTSCEVVSPWTTEVENYDDEDHYINFTTHIDATRVDPDGLAVGDTVPLIVELTNQSEIEFSSTVLEMRIPLGLSPTGIRIQDMDGYFDIQDQVAATFDTALSQNIYGDAALDEDVERVVQACVDENDEVQVIVIYTFDTPLPANTQSEFLMDIALHANTYGSYVINASMAVYGVSEDGIVYETVLSKRSGL